ncbi:PREDICTED: putative RING-H2 finger protein ATL19 [Tarenaya hassleriana]|uniref:putative RING-H2 finger protein ATL19 n=1 Tax=Tarenaya hassleriana TaxID=28532 RepID=UPI00053C92E7|nr:PREDICTED: putative RING-H2 finger protein ATL19 [Tarenaya hassleriana]
MDSSSHDASNLMTLLGLVIIVGVCFALAVLIAITATALFIYLVIQCLLRPFLGRCLHIDLEIGERGQRARIVTYHAIIPADLRLQPGIFEARDHNEPREKHGLRQNTIETLLPRLPVEERSVGYGECVICLSDYAIDGECRVFPICGHMYHVHCIDAWLKNHLTCPICRKELSDSRQKLETFRFVSRD